MSYRRISIKFGGESGQGINTVGKILSKALNKYGFKIFAYREYPSLIRGGIASYQIDFSNKKINSSSRNCNILLAFTAESVSEYLNLVPDNGIVVYDSKDVSLSEEQEIQIKKRNISSIFLDSSLIATESGGTEIMSNAVMLGFLWRILKLDEEFLIKIILDFFKNKNIDFEAERKCISAGYNSPTFRPEFGEKLQIPKEEFLKKKSITITGNDSLASGALSAGVRAYYAYPMTPATSILKFLGDTSKETGVLVKQAENEITAVQMALGSMYMGTRALTATSGGGFDLMTETISCSAMSETPLVIVLSQRVGAGTGVPTWTGAGDLNVALKSGHGEFPRCVIAASDAESSYTLIQKAFNIAEKYQLPVILLTEKQISESFFTLDALPKNIQIDRGLEDGTLRYEITDSGISPRWLPSKEKRPYLSSSDEHLESGDSTENSDDIIMMSEKRQRKLSTLSEEIPEPKLYGPKDPRITFVGWGSTKNVVLDAIELGNSINYLHYEFILPFKGEILKQLVEEGRRLVLIENNQSGELGSYIKEQTGYEFNEKLLKYDGRPFFLEDILDYLKI